MLAHPVLHGIARGEPSSALMEHAHDVIDDHALLFHMVRLLTQGGWQVDEKKASDRHGVGDRVRASERQPLHAKSHRDYKGIAPEIVASWSEEEVAAHEKLVAARCWRILAERHRPTYEHSKRLYHIFRSWNVWVNSSLLLKETKRKYTFPHLDATANVWAAAHDVGKKDEFHVWADIPGELSEGEREVMKLHILRGRQIYKSFGGFQHVGAFNHHERGDGKGYPNGLHSGELNLIEQVFHMIDTLDALCTRTDKKELGRKPRTGNQVMHQLKQIVRKEVSPELQSVFVSFAEWFLFAHMPSQRTKEQCAYNASKPKPFTTFFPSWYAKPEGLDTAFDTTQPSVTLNHSPLQPPQIPVRSEVF
jgi:HD-GYP domain-containing protein (c-di-GMP phosphodiesterase class II)